MCLDTGAGMHLVCNEEFAIPGSKRPSNRIIYGAGGTFKAVEEVENIIPLNLDGGSIYEYHFTAPIARECPHHLLSVGKMSAENVCGLTMEKGSYSECFLDFGDGKRCTSHNQGILIFS